jgi:hypothetical protein
MEQPQPVLVRVAWWLMKPVSYPLWLAIALWANVVSNVLEAIIAISEALA